ncbi:Gfo/Idh/MocA family oxidoreductase [Halobacillus salinarum]|uniref:Gfo/Idh/MocA family oxidoreductase n=1 Tax=Halobacillus salinarum TaxID=2932257 RepID=A0ABY4EI05_9BACI|nr:Gfo/Idh/MocA family oxidoreductase [Halobacillus salinarum]UOQ44108.1 Gfo/Idh/MocA family oxidoreductase [Halobacillus salinarum]
MNEKRGIQLRIGIVGTGRTIGVASDHLKGIQAVPEWELAAVYDIVMENAELWVNQHGLSKEVICESLEELMGKVDAVTICTDNRSHGAIAREAFKHNLPVLCEKPLSINYEESLKLAEEAELAGVVNYMGMQYRYHPYAQLIKEQIDQGELGEVFSYRHKIGGGRIGNPNVGLEWRMKKETSGAGAIADFGIHQIDLLKYFLEEQFGPIREVQAELGTYIEKRQVNEQEVGEVTNDDLSVMILRMTNGALVTLNNSRLLPQEGDGLEIVGTKAALSMDQEGRVFLRKRKDDNSWAAEKEMLEFQEKHKFPGLARGRQYQEFYEAITEGKAYKLSFAYAAEAARIIDAGLESSQSGKRIHVSK